MKRVLRSLLSIVIVFAILFGAAPLSGFKGVGSSLWKGLCSLAVSAKEGVEEIIENLIPANVSDNTLAATGQCGDNVYWSFNSSTGALNISGTGEMYNYSYYDSPFEDDSSIKSIIIEHGVTSIGNSAFIGCSSLTSVTIGNGVKSIGYDAFEWCSSLTSVTIGNSVTIIEYDAFEYCSSLTSITVDNNNNSFSSDSFGVLYNKNKTVLIQYPIGNERTSFTIPESVSSIGYRAFEDCSSLISVTIGNNLKSIDYWAFEGCSSLTSIDIPDSVTSIGEGAFEGCSSLTSVTIGNGVTSIEYDAFSGCRSLTSVTIGNSVTSIGNSAFRRCSSLTSIEIPDSVTSIYMYAFYDCSSLTSVTIGNSVTSIGYFAFEGCSSLTSITVDNNNNNYSSDSFGVLYNKDKTELLQYPAGNERTSFTIPESVTSIGDDAFAYCSSLTSVTIPDSVTSIGGWAFRGCSSLTSITVDNNNNNYSSDSFGVLYNKDKTELLQYPFGNERTSFTIPDSVTRIGVGAFYGCISLTSVEIPDSVTSIGYDAFEWCSSLTSITIPDSVTSIGEAAFRYCSSLTSIVIPDSVTSIGWYAFEDCSSLTSITIGNGVTSIGGEAFNGCSSLKDVYYSGSQQQWKNISIGSYNSPLTNATIHYNSTVQSFSAVEEWKEGSRGTGKTTLSLNSDMLSKSSTEYNHGLAQLSSQLVTLGYANNDYKDNEEKYKNADEDTIKAAKRHNSYLENALSKLGMSDIEMNVSTGRDSENYFFANRKIDVYGTEYTFVVAGLIGSHGKQWDSNFDPQGKDSSKSHSDYVKENYHTGFYDAKEYVKGKLKTYLDDLYNRNNLSKGNVKILICGHSRGAAASNLLAADLIDSQNYALADNIYTYAFATPNSATKTVANKPQYNRIVNFLNPEDFVTKVLPTQWGYTRFGKSYVLPSNDNEKQYYKFYSNMRKEYNKLSPNMDYIPYFNEKDVYDPVQRLASAFNTTNPKVAMECYYGKRKLCAIHFTWTMFDFFQNTVCTFVNGSGIINQGFEALRGLIPLQFSSSAFGTMARFFLICSDEGISDDCLHLFKKAHCAQTYCAYLLSMNEAQATKDRDSKRATINCPVDVEVYDKETGELVGRIVNNVVDEEIAAKENSVNMYVEGDQKEFWLPSDGDYEVKLIGNDNGKMDYSVAEIDENAAETAVVNFFDVPVVKDEAYTCDMGDDKTIEETTLENETGDTVQPTENMTGDEIISYNINVTTEGDGYATNSMTVTSGDRVTLEATPEEGANFLGWYENGALISTETQLSFVAKSDRNITAKFSERSPLRSVSIGDVSLGYKSSATITPQITADEDADYEVTFTSSNPSAISVDNNGRVTSNKTFGFTPGSATITCTVTDKNSGNTVTDTCTVSVQFSAIQWIIKIILFGWIWY